MIAKEPHVLIVGASRGLGHALASEYARQGWRVTGTVRDDAGEARLRNVSEVTVERLDVTDTHAVDALAARTAAGSLDLLFVNAGVSGDIAAAVADVPMGEWVGVMRTNAFAPLYLIEKMHAAIAVRGTVAVMSSILGSVASNERATWESYRMSKAALNMGFRSLAVRIGQPAQAFVAVAPVCADGHGRHAGAAVDRGKHFRRRRDADGARGQGRIAVSGLSGPDAAVVSEMRAP